jgi:serine/threonine protein kinase
MRRLVHWRDCLRTVCLVKFIKFTFRLSGTAPYKGGDFDKDLEDIMRHRLSFDTAVWRDVSQAAKDFITNTLKINPAHRLTVEQALQHPWITRVGKRVARDRSANIDIAASTSEDSARLLSTSPDLYPNVREGLDAQRATKNAQNKSAISRQSTNEDDDGATVDQPGFSAKENAALDDATRSLQEKMKNIKL